MKRLLVEYIEHKARELQRRVKVTLLGFGSTNRAFLEALLPLENAYVTVRQRGLSRGKISDSVAVYNGENAFSGLYEDVIIPSPSVRRERLSIPYHAEVITDYDLLFRAKQKELFLISGSDGKSTTTELSSLLLQGSISHLFTGGNIGTPLILADKDSEAFLLELSSFTLRYSLPMGGRALLTNITPNHLDWHDGIEEYKNTKLSLVRRADEPILNLDDEISRSEARETHAFCLISSNLNHHNIARSYKTEHTVTVENDSVMLDGEMIIPLREIKRRERHNVSNLCSAIAMTIGYANRERIREVAHSFEGLSERCEFFDIDGISFISSSIDTSPERTRTTLEGLGREAIIILGGRGKRLPLEPLRSPLIKYAKRIAIYGEAAQEICVFLDSDPTLGAIPHNSFPRLAGAIDYATMGVKPGDTVVLSPAATSYGEFENYSHRGKFFKQYILSKYQKI